MEVSFNIGKETYEVPEAISLELFENAMAWDLSDLKNVKPFVATLVGCSLQVLNQLDEETYLFISGVCLHRMNVVNCEMLDEIDDYSIKPFENFTFGEWVDLDTLLATSPTDNVIEIAKMLYNAPTEVVKTWDIKKVWGAIIQLSMWRARVYKEYDEFFELEGMEPSEEGGNANVALMWYNSIMVLANEEFTKIKDVVERPYREALNYLTWKKAKVQKEQMEIMKRKNDLQRRTR